MRLRGHRSFNYIYKNSTRYFGKLVTIRVVEANPDILRSHKIYSNSSNIRIGISISSKVSKKSVIRNKIRRIIHNHLINELNLQNIHKNKWALVSLNKSIQLKCCPAVLNDCEILFKKSGLIS